MKINGLEFDAAVLCGGSSTRMGHSKALLPLNSGSFAGEIAKKTAPFGKVLVSCGAAGDRGLENVGTERVFDHFRECGPAGGIHAVLSYSEADAVLFVPCDVPMFTYEAGVFLCSRLGEECDAVVISDEDGRLHPLTAVYRRSCAPVFEKCLGEGIYRITDILDELKVCKVSADELPGGKEILLNVNSPEDYEALLERLKTI